MKLLTLSLTAYGAAVLLSLSPWSAAQAQTDGAPAAATASPHGDWTLREREQWLNDRIGKSRDNGSLDRVEYDHARHNLDELRQAEDRMRDSQHGQLTDNQTADLDSQLDSLAAKIHWANASAFQRPW